MQLEVVRPSLEYLIICLSTDRACNSTDKLLPPLLTRFRDIHFKPYTEEEFVEIVVNVLDREGGRC
jgi:hypothetical protein